MKFGTPDDGLERLEATVRAVHAEPGRFRSVSDVARHAGVGTSRLEGLVRLHWHSTSSVLLARARIHAARRALEGGARAADVASDVGFERLSDFDASFRRWTGLGAREWVRLGSGDGFVLSLPAGYHAEPVLRVHGRDGASPTERVKGLSLVKVLMINGRPMRLEIEIGRRAARCIVRTGRVPPDRASMLAAHAAAVRLLGLDQDPVPFERLVARRVRTRGLVNGRAGTRVPLTATVFEALVWCIVGQQVNLAFAYGMRRSLIELAGSPATGGFRAHPAPEQVAQLDYSDLTTRRYSRRKAEYLIDAARAVQRGDLDIDDLARRPATAVERRLLDVRGLGPWSTHYLLMRGFGFADCVPLGDTGLSAALTRFYALEERPDTKAVRALMQTFAPYRSLATFHLWLSLGDAP